MSASTIWQLEKRREEDRKMLNNITFIRQKSQIYCCYLHFAFAPLKHENRITVFFLQNFARRKSMNFQINKSNMFKEVFKELLVRFFRMICILFR